MNHKILQVNGFTLSIGLCVSLKLNGHLMELWSFVRLKVHNHLVLHFKVKINLFNPQMFTVITDEYHLYNKYVIIISTFKHCISAVHSFTCS